MTNWRGRVRKLGEAEYRATIAPHPVAADPEAEPSFDFWPYFDEIPPEDFAGHDFAAGVVPYAWTMPGGNHEHVLIECPTPNVFLVLVLNPAERTVIGHHLLNFHTAYGLPD